MYSFYSWEKLINETVIRYKENQKGYKFDGYFYDDARYCPCLADKN